MQKQCEQDLQVCSKVYKMKKLFLKLNTVALDFGSAVVQVNTIIRCLTNTCLHVSRHFLILIS